MKVLGIMFLSATVLASMVFLISSAKDDRTCIRWEEETYRDNSQGIALYVATKNAGFIGMSEEKTRVKCVEYSPTKGK